MVGDNVHMFNKGYRFVNSMHFYQCASQRYDKLRIDLSIIHSYKSVIM